MIRNLGLIFAFSIILLPISMTLSGIFLLLILIEVFITNKTLNCEINSYFTKIMFLFLITSIIQGLFTIKPLFHYAGLIGHYLIYLIIFKLAYEVIKSKNDLDKYILKPIVFSGFINSIIGVLDYFKINQGVQLFYLPLYGGDYLINLKTYQLESKASGFSMNPNNLGCFLILTIFMNIFYLSNKNYKNNFIYYAILFSQILCLVLTKSRGALLAFLVGCFFLIILLLKNNKKIALSFLLGTAILSMILFTNYYEVISTAFDPNHRTNLQRMEVWSISIQIIKDFPFGVGILNYENIYPYYWMTGQKYLPHAHNWYLHTFIESGLVNGSIFFLFYFSILGHFFKKLKDSNLIILISLISFSIFNLSDYILTDTRICILLVLIIFYGFFISSEQEV